MKREIIGVAAFWLILVLIVCASIYGIDHQIKKATGGKLGLLGALELGAGGVVAYQVYKAFGSGGTATVAESGAVEAITAESGAATVEAGAATTEAGAGAVEVLQAGAESGGIVEEIILGIEEVLPFVVI